MTGQAVARLIREELREAGDPASLHGLDLVRCLLPPVRTRYANPTGEPEVLELWLVFHAPPRDQEGYEIAYDEERRMFGLAAGGAWVGWYGDFVTTLAGM